MKVYLPECNLPKDFWKNELKDFSNKNGSEGSMNAESGPMLLDVVEGYLKYENLSQTRMAGRRMVNFESDPTLNTDHRNMRRPPSSTSVGGNPHMGRQMPSSQTSDRRGGSSTSNTRKEEYNWGYDDDILEEVLRTNQRYGEHPIRPESPEPDNILEASRQWCRVASVRWTPVRYWLAWYCKE